MYDFTLVGIVIYKMESYAVALNSNEGEPDIGEHLLHQTFFSFPKSGNFKCTYLVGGQTILINWSKPEHRQKPKLEHSGRDGTDMNSIKDRMAQSRLSLQHNNPIETKS